MTAGCDIFPRVLCPHQNVSIHALIGHPSALSNADDHVMVLAKQSRNIRSVREHNDKIRSNTQSLGGGFLFQTFLCDSYGEEVFHRLLSR